MKKIITYSLVAVIAITSIVAFFPRAILPVAHAGDSSQNPTVDTSNVNTYMQEQLKTENNQRALDKTQPLPSVTNSLERANLIKRLETFNKPDKISYIYLVSFGRVMSFYTIKGKVSSVNSYLSAPTQLIRGNGAPCDYYHDNCYQVESPDTDGSYGDNGKAIFFFTTAGAYVEWNGEYMIADQPLQLATAPEMVMSVK